MTVASPVQRQFNFAGLDRACLALVPAVRCLLACDEDRVLQLIGDHQLVAYDLRAPDAARSYPAIWFQSIRDFWIRREAGFHETLFYNGEADELVFRDLFPTRREALRLGELKLSLSVTSTHLHNLLDAHLLRSVPGTGDRVSKAPMIYRASVVEFLTGRRM